MLYEGVLRPVDMAAARPVSTWRFENRQLQAHLSRSVFGWGYSVRLPWGEEPPRTSSVTLLARYLPPGGEAMPSRPVTVLMGPR